MQLHYTFRVWLRTRENWKMVFEATPVVLLNCTQVTGPCARKGDAAEYWFAAPPLDQPPEGFCTVPFNPLTVTNAGPGMVSEMMTNSYRFPAEQ